MKPKIFLSGDHAGFEAKNEIRDWLRKKGFEIRDFGPYVYNKNDDYPDFVVPMVKTMKDKNSKVIRTPKLGHPKGIIIAGSGEGEAIAANRFNGIRAAVYHGKNLEIVKTTREHNDANILCLGSRFVKQDEMKKAIDVFLKTKFKAGRHKRRLGKIERIK
jgi:ribose 5-phosphate isomerase B